MVNDSFRQGLKQFLSALFYEDQPHDISQEQVYEGDQQPFGQRLQSSIQEQRRLNEEKAKLEEQRRIQEAKLAEQARQREEELKNQAEDRARRLAMTKRWDRSEILTQQTLKEVGIVDMLEELKTELGLDYKNHDGRSYWRYDERERRAVSHSHGSVHYAIGAREEEITIGVESHTSYGKCFSNTTFGDYYDVLRTRILGAQICVDEDRVYVRPGKFGDDKRFDSTIGYEGLSQALVESLAQGIENRRVAYETGERLPPKSWSQHIKDVIIGRG